MKQTSDSPIKTGIPARERLIFALDVPDLERARALVDTLGDSVAFYKLGLEFFLSGHYFELMSELKGQGKKVFADLKLFDIPATVAAAVAVSATTMGHGASPAAWSPAAAGSGSRKNAAWTIGR